MDIELENKIKKAIEHIKNYAIDDVDFNKMDPIAKLMLVAAINEAEKIQDLVESYPERITDRFCSDFIPAEKLKAIPAIGLLNPEFRKGKDSSLISVGNGALFTYRYDPHKMPLNYIPLFNTTLVPHSRIYVVTPKRMTYDKEVRAITMDRSNRVWVGITTKAEVESLQGVSLLITGTSGILPEHIYVGTENQEIEFATIKEIEDIEMAEPFDAQQASGQFFSFINVWKEFLMNMEDNALLYLTDKVCNRDLFKPRPFPRVFQQWLEDETLDCFDPSTLWLQMDFPEGYEVPDNCKVTINILPVTNVDVCHVTLTPSAPIAKLQRNEDAYFLDILETSAASHHQGFNMKDEEIIIRDFDASCYHNGDLYRDVRNLYNRFVNDYYAFIEYNGIKDGEVIKQLRETINRIGKSVGERNSKYKFDSGTYVMRNMNQISPSSSIKVSYITTLGKTGNIPKIGHTMENKKLPFITQQTLLVTSCMAGADKATADQRYELLRYFSLTNDRLFTKMDIEAFLRKEIMAEFGKSEFKRIFIKISVEGTGGRTSLQRGLYIDIEFKDKKNYEKAVRDSFDKLMKQKIEGKSCISMPINVVLTNLEEQ